AYVFAKKDGKWVNYNVELVRAGLAPYFTKYGYSRRFHGEFVAAEKEARAAERGIWDPKKQHYPDYDERKQWWDARAEFIKAFEADAAGKDSWIALTNSDALERLEAHVGEEVVVLGAIAGIKEADGGPTRVLLSRKRTNDFPLIFFSKDVLAASGVAHHVGEYVRVRGAVRRSEDKQKHTTLEIVIRAAGQVSAAAVASTAAEQEEEETK